jgi:cytosine/creatinine deaminase
VNCSLSSNNILNPATPYGDCSMIRIANLYANTVQLDRTAQLHECFRMLTDRLASLLHLRDYGFAVGHPADVVIINAQSPAQAISEIAQPVAAFKNGRRTVRWDLPRLCHRNSCDYRRAADGNPDV